MIVTSSLATVAMLIVIAGGFLCWLALEIVVRRREAHNQQAPIQAAIPAKCARDARGRFCKRSAAP
jgi:hypothetical protein